MNTGRNTEGDNMNLSAPATTPALRQRKLRKGANSCWYCKRRKVKCTFRSATDSVCENCQRRGTACVGQQYPELLPGPQRPKGDRLGQIDDRMVRVEAMLTKLSNQGATKGTDACKNGRFEADKPLLTKDIPNPATAKLDPGPAPQLTTSNPPIDPSMYSAVTAPTILTPESQTTSSYPASKFDRVELEELSEALLAAFPSQRDLQIICQTNKKVSMIFQQITAKSAERLVHNGADTMYHDTTSYSADSHPVLLARRMLKFTYLLQQLKMIRVEGLSESLSTITTRISNTVSRLITSNDDLVGTFEGLECILLEGTVESNHGNIRRSWVAFRRALTIAQLMRINKPNPPPIQPIDPATKVNTKFLWFRVVYMDRFLSLLLGLPQGTHDTSMASDEAFAADTPIGRLERTHCAIASRILRLEEEDFSIDDYATVRQIDTDLLRAANTMPTNFWLPPIFYGLENDKETAFWETLRLIDQLVHYSLLTKLHLPYLFYAGLDRKYEYSKIACIGASREILLRFIAYRGFNRIVSCCRPLDFFSLMAALTLLLAHLESHQHEGDDNLLVHQRLSDRAMMKQVIEGMDEVQKANEDSFSNECLSLLQRLISIEEQAAAGETTYKTQNACDGEQSEGNDGNVIFRMAVPYFGIIKISRGGQLSREEPNASRKVPNHATGSVHIQSGLMNMGEDSTSVYAERDFELHSMEQLERRAWAANATAHSSHPLNYGLQEPNTGNQLDSQLSRATTLDADIQEYSHPVATASLDDWAFQGVDMSFFDSLMKTTEQSGFDRTDDNM